jgi:UDPglucose 6-dehydrogenase
LKLLLKNPVIFDGRNIYDPKLLKELGINYFGIGRGDSIHIGDGEIPTLKGSK